MGSLHLRIPDEKHQRLKELATIALTEDDIETRFKIRANRGSTEKALEVLAKLKQDFGDSE